MDSPADQNQNFKQDPSTFGPIPTPGSLGYQPVKPSGPEATGEKATSSDTANTAETPPQVETIQPETQAEKLKTYEKIGTLAQEVQDEQKRKQAETARDIYKGSLQEHLVDKTEEPVKLHPVEKSKDKLTPYADDKEEEFITEVTAAHDRD